METYQSKTVEREGFVLPEGRAARRAVLHEGLLAMSVQLGLSEFIEILEEEADAVAGPKGKRQKERGANRWGRAVGSVVLGGRKVSVDRPRVRTRAGEEILLPSYEVVRRVDPLNAGTLEKILAGVATRQYDRALDPIGGVRARTSSTSKSSVSRRIVKATGRALARMMGRRLDDLRLVAVIIDGITFAKHTIVAALGIDHQGVKHPLGIWDGATENATLVKSLLSNLEERGLSVSGGCLFLIDGSKALRKAIADTYGSDVPIQRCRVHKLRNVTDHLPHEARVWVSRKFRDALKETSVDAAKKAIEALARSLETKHPGAAASLREGLDDLLTVKRLDLPERIARSLSTTNSLESAFSRTRGVAHHVKRWRSGSMALRWCASGLAEACRTFRKVNGYREIPFLIAALTRQKEVASATKAA